MRLCIVADRHQGPSQGRYGRRARSRLVAWAGWWVKKMSANLCGMDAEDPLFILYTWVLQLRKGVLHTTGGYIVYAATTFKYVFDYKPEDIYWCTADIGWVTGHSYIIYGPMCNAATTLMFEGIPTYPDAGRFWEVVDKYKVSIFYTAPTAIRAFGAIWKQLCAKA